MQPEETKTNKVVAYFHNLGIELPAGGEEEVFGLTSTVPAWFWRSAEGSILRFEVYDRSRARELAEYLWQGRDPDSYDQPCSFFLGGLSAKPARLAFFAVLDSLALITWRSASSGLKEKWIEAIGGLDVPASPNIVTPDERGKAVHLWTIAWRFAGHREYEWMERQLSLTSTAVREQAKSLLVKLVPELSPDSPLWHATRYGLRQDAHDLYLQLLDDINQVEPTTARMSVRRRDRQTRLGEIFSRFSESCTTCAASGGSCCSRDIPHYYFSKFDLGYLKSSGVPLPEFDEEQAASNSCIFLSESGCRFPAHLRPAVCLSHTCDPIYAQLTQKEKSLLTHFELRRLMTMRGPETS